jgi:hypothetical protein
MSDVLKLIRRRQSEAQINLRQLRRWFDETPGASANGGDKPADKATDKPADKAKADAGADKWIDSLPPEAQSEIKKLRNEAKKARLQLREYEKTKQETETQKKAEEEKKLVDSKDYDKLYAKEKAEKEQLAADLKAERLERLRERIARKYDLPDELAARLRGDTEEDIEDDAKTLQKIVAPDGKKKGSTTTAVPGGKPSELTYADRKAKKYGGRSSNSFGGG